MSKLTFEYNGYHFTPYMKLAANFEDKAANLNHDRALFQNSDSFSHKDFYDASPLKDCDLFRCEENGKIYIPAYNLLEYKGQLKGLSLNEIILKKPKKSIVEQLQQPKESTGSEQISENKINTTQQTGSNKTRKNQNEL